MISALLLAGIVSAAPDRYDAVEQAYRHADNCEQQVVGDSFLSPSRIKRSLEDVKAEAKQSCAQAWADHAKARQTYFRSDRRLLRRLVPGFRPMIEACWTALDGQRNDWPGASENTALEECKNAKN